MRTRTAVVFIIVAVLALTAPAQAKGPSGGTIEGEGLDAPIVIGQGEGTPGGDQIINDLRLIRFWWTKRRGGATFRPPERAGLLQTVDAA